MTRSLFCYTYLFVLLTCLYVGGTVVAHAHGTDAATDDHSAEVITEASAAAHLELARTANEDSKAYVASLRDTDVDAWRGSVPHLSHLDRDLAAAQAAYDAGSYASAADLAQQVINHAPEIMNGSVLATGEMNFNQFATNDAAHQGHSDVEVTAATSESDEQADIDALRARVVELMQILVTLLTQRLAEVS